ncbi:MAG: hypothetical protein RLP45_06570, partial [Haliea sp.]
LGETMAVLMVAGNVVRLPDSLFTPVRTLTANIALEMSYASGDHRAAPVEKHHGAPLPCNLQHQTGQRSCHSFL